jgi:hypothetical protein
MLALLRRSARTMETGVRHHEDRVSRLKLISQHSGSGNAIIGSRSGLENCWASLHRNNTAKTAKTIDPAGLDCQLQASRMIITSGDNTGLYGLHIRVGAGCSNGQHQWEFILVMRPDGDVVGEQDLDMNPPCCFAHSYEHEYFCGGTSPRVERSIPPIACFGFWVLLLPGMGDHSSLISELQAPHTVPWITSGLQYTGADHLSVIMLVSV